MSVSEPFVKDLPFTTTFSESFFSACFPFLCKRAPVTKTSFPQWGTTDAEIKFPSVENPELKVNVVLNVHRNHQAY